MADKHGWNSTIGLGEESTYGTAVTPTRFFEFTSEGFTTEPARMESRAIRAQSVQKTAKTGQRVIAGDLSGELPTVGFGLFLKHLLGAPAISQPDDSGAPTVYDQTFTPGDVDGLGLTVQKVIDGVPFTYSGCKVQQMQLAARVGELCTFTASLVGQDSTTETAAASPSYPSGLDCFTFLGGFLSIGGDEQEVQNIGTTIANTLKADRWKIGSAVTREPKRNGFRQITGDFEVNFTDLDLYDLFLAGTLADLVLRFRGSEIEGGLYEQLELTCTVQVNGSSPTVSGPEEVMQTIPWKAYTGPDGTDADALTAVYRSTDATP